MARDTPVTAFRLFYQIFRWCVLLALIVIIVLALKPPGDVPEGADPIKAPQQAREVEDKLQQLQDASSRGDAGVQVDLSAGEVNGFLSQSMASPGGNTSSPVPSDDPNPSPRTRTVSVSDTDDPKVAQSAVKDFRVVMADDEVVGFFVVDFHGKDLDITISGRPTASNGYMTFSPTGFKVGSLSIPVSLVNPALQRRLNDPDMHEKLKLPDFVGDLRVQNGQIVITGK